jgi:gliding motility-associated-like protein
VVASAGQSPYSYTWNPGSLTTATVSGLCSGNYFVLVSDANGCASASSAQVNAPTPIVTSSPIIINPLCNNNTNGSITVVASGGTLPYSYSWLPGGETTNTISNLSPGTYSVSITDNNGCSIQQSATIVNPAALTLTDVVTNATCNTLSNASIDITVNGGTGAYSYQWTGTQSSITQDLINIPIGTYSVTISDINGCSISNNYVITSFETVIAVAGNDTSFCQASSITLNGNASINATTYNWFQIPGNTNVGATSNITIIPPTGTTSYYLVVGNAGVCTSNDTITISSLALPTAIGSNDTTICLFASASLNASASINAVAYNWYSFPSNTLISSNAVTSVTPPVGVNTFYVVVANSLGCTNVDSVYITVLAAPIARAGNDTSYCYNGSQFTLNASNSINANSYQWFQLPANTSLGNTPVVSATPSVGTNSYYVSILNSSGCRNNDTIVITVLALPIVSAGNDVTILLGASTTIGGSPTGPTGSVFSWLPNQNLDNPTISNPQATPNATTTFTVLVTSTDGCIASDDITVIITPRINPPSGFTPNDDGTNDYWIIDNIELYPDCVVEVYNRWGELLFQSKGYKEKWNGTYKGKQLPVGTYYYIINLNNELYPEPYTGPLTIMR